MIGVLIFVVNLGFYLTRRGWGRGVQKWLSRLGKLT